MNAESRTAKSLKNSIVALAFYFVHLILQFFSRKIFLECLGTEILGLNTTATNLLQFLNLAELGIGYAIACTLYKPILEKDIQTINEILSLQGWLYRRIALVVGGGALIMMAFFPLIFAKISLPLWYAYASFSALLVSALLGYAFEAPQPEGQRRDHLQAVQLHAVNDPQRAAPAQCLRTVDGPDVGSHGRLEDPEQPGYFRLREPHLAPGRAADRDPLPVDRNRPRENALHRRRHYRSAGRAFISRRMVWSSTLA